MKKLMSPKKPQKLWLFALLPLWLLLSCSDIGILSAIEDAEALSDGNLNNKIFIHSMARINNTMYLGSKRVWQRSNSSGKWRKTSLPFDDAPVVSIASAGQRLFVASNKNVYMRENDGPWSSPVLSGNFRFYALVANSDTVLAADSANNIYAFTAGVRQKIPQKTKVSGFAKIGSTFYLASGKEIKQGNNLQSLTPMTDTPNKKNEIVALLAVELSGKDYLAMLDSRGPSGGKLHLYDITARKWESSKLNNNISMVQIGDQLLVGRFGAGYRIYDVPKNIWKTSMSSDGFTDAESLVALASGDSIQNLSLGALFFYDDTNDAKDRIYAATLGNRGMFGAKRKGKRWFWGLE